MKQLKNSLALTLLALSFQSLAGTDEHKLNQKDINESPTTRTMGSFVLKNQNKEQILSLDSKSEESFQSY
jgi:hypothetical protein